MGLDVSLFDFSSGIIETTGSSGLLQRGDQFHAEHQFQQVEHGRYCQVRISSPHSGSNSRGGYAAFLRVPFAMLEAS